MIGTETPLDTLAYLRRALDELKGRQIIGGSSTVVHKNQTGATYDYSASVSGFSQRFIVTFTSVRQQYSLADLTIAVAIDSPANPADFYDEYYLNIFQLASDPSFPYITNWVVDLYKTTSGTHTYYLKATVMSVDTGTIS